jgi:hydrogenase maturation protease
MSEFRHRAAWHLRESPRFSPDGALAPACLIVGLGNCLLCDDGIGVHAVRELTRQPPANALVVEVGTDVFSAVRWMEQAPRVLAIDAMDAGGEPGALYQCRAIEVGVERCQASLHELGLLAMLEFLPKNRQPEITVLGVQPAVIRYGLELSPVVQRVLPAVVGAARTIVAAWRPLSIPQK